MQRTLQTILLTRDPGLESELTSLGAELGGPFRLAIRVEEDARRAVVRAIERRVDLILVELQQGGEALVQLAEDLRDAEHAPAVAAIYRPQEFGGDASLSSRFVGLLRAGVRDFLSRPLARNELEALLEREFGDHQRVQQSVGRVVSFVGSKGGVGKSTLAINTAVELARRGSTLLMDASLQHGVAADLLGLSPSATLADAGRQLERLDGQLLSGLVETHPCGIDLLSAPADAIEAAAVDEQVMSRVITVARRSYDFVVVDTFPLLDSVTLAILDMSDRAFVVLNNSAPTINGTAELLRVLDRLGVERTRAQVVLNNTHPGRGIDPTDVATRLDRTIEHVVPYYGRVLAAANAGAPPMTGLRRLGRWGRALRTLASAAAASPASGSLDGRAQPLGLDAAAQVATSEEVGS